MRKEFELKYREGKFIITKKGGSDEECFSIDENNLQFDTRKFYEGLFLDVNESIEIELINDCNSIECSDTSIQKKAKHVYDSLKHITQEICLRLNEQCFTNDSSE